MLTESSNIVGRDKAAILLLYLGEAVAADILRNLDEEEIHQVTMKMSGLKNVKTEVIDDVLDEFSEIMLSDNILSLGGDDYVRNILLKALGEDKAKSIIQLLAMPMVGGRSGSDSKEKPVADSLRKMDPEAVANLVREEHPQTTALILSHLKPERVAQVIPFLRDEFRAEVVIRLGTLDRVAPGAMDKIEEVLRSKINKVALGESSNIGGLGPVAEMMNTIDRSIGNSIMEKIEERRPELAEEIKNLMFVFEDLILLDSRSMQMVLKEVSNEDLTVALKTATDEVKDQVFSNVSERAAGMIREDLEAMGPVRVKDVESAQQAILSIVRRLEGEGKIVISGRGGEEIVV